MGQQQLLLVILVTVIVGVATVVAISVFGKGAENANIDATRQDVLTLAAQAQAWVIKPELLGGGNGDFTGVTVDEIGYGYDSREANGLTFENANATFVIAGDAAELSITATPKQLDGIDPDASTDWTSTEFKATVTRASINFDSVPTRTP